MNNSYCYVGFVILLLPIQIFSKEAQHMSDQTPDPYSEYLYQPEKPSNPYPPANQPPVSPYPSANVTPASPYSQMPYANAPYTQPVPGPYAPQAPYPPPTRGNGQAIARLVLGIISMIA